MSPDANEKLTRRIMGSLGVRPVGHQDPNAGDPGRVATAPPVPEQRANRLPPWWEAKKPVTGSGDHAPVVATGDTAAPIPPKPAAPPRDWLDDIINDNATGPEPTPEPDAEPDEEPAEAPAKKATPPPKAGRKKKQEKAEKPRPGAPRTAWDSRPQSPRQSLLEAWDRVPYRLKWLIYHLTAAYMGWSMGLVDWCTSVTAWISAGRSTDPQSIFLYAVGVAAFILHHATRQRWWPVAWLAAVPASSLVVGVLLYGNGWTQLEFSL